MFKKLRSVLFSFIVLGFLFQGCGTSIDRTDRDGAFSMEGKLYKTDKIDCTGRTDAVQDITYSEIAFVGNRVCIHQECSNEEDCVTDYRINSNVFEIGSILYTISEDGKTITSSDSEVFFLVE